MISVRHSAKALQETVNGFDDGKFFARHIRQQDQRRYRIRVPVCCKRRVQIYVGDNLAVDYDKGVAVQQCACVVHGAAGTKDHRLFNILKLHSKPAAVAERTAHRLWTMMKVDGDFVATVASEVFSYITDQRFAQDGNGGFGAVFGK